MRDYIPTIGLEVHCQLRTETKMFCACPIVHDGGPNSSICPVCMGHPGTLPTVNDRAVRLGVRAGLAFGCTVNNTSIFARKHYFYPDLPKGYQISQFEQPLCSGGAIHIHLDGEERRFALTRIHLEEDAGKMRHQSTGSMLDWNRGGTPLIEIVGEPDLHTPEEAEAWMRMLHRVVVEAGVCTGDMEKGHLRCDANISMARPGEPLGGRVEVKNINSFRFVAKALRAEIARQISVLQSGGRIAPQTRKWNGRGTDLLRTKEQAADYRYFPEPDLRPLVVSPDEIRAEAGVLDGAPLDRWLIASDAAALDGFCVQYGLSADDATAILADEDVAEFYSSCVEGGGDARAIANWVRGPLMRRLNASDAAPGTALASSEMSPKLLVDLDRLVADGTINRNVAKGLFDEVFETGAAPGELVAKRGLAQVGDEAEIRAVVAELVQAHPAEVAKYRGGNAGILGFFMGQVMRRFSGKADPRLTNRVVREELDRDE